MIMHYTPQTQPRDPVGKWINTDLRGWQQYTDRRGEIHKYYVNDPSLLADGSILLSYASRGRNFTPAEQASARIHVMGTSEQEMMAVSSSQTTTFGIINHDKVAPVNTFSMQRGSHFEDIKRKTGIEDTDFGGYKYDSEAAGVNTLDVQKAEQANQKAFTDNKPYYVSTQDLTNKEIEARHWYAEQFPDWSDKQLRDAPVYVYVDRDGDLEVKPVYTGKLDKNGELAKHRNPNTHGGSRACRVKGSDLTRIASGLQSEGYEHVNIAISGGTETTKSGHPVRNALHFRHDYEDPTTRSQMTMWGTVEQYSHGAQSVKADKFTNADGSRNREAYTQALAEHKQAEQRIRERAASRFVNPKTPDEAARLLRKRTGNDSIKPGQTGVRKNGDVTRMVGKGDIRRVYTSQGEWSRTEYLSPQSLLNKTHADDMERVKRVSYSRKARRYTVLMDSGEKQYYDRSASRLKDKTVRGFTIEGDFAKQK